MTLRTKTFLTFFALMLVFFIVIVTYSNLVIYRSFLAEERDEVTAIANDARHAVDTLAMDYRLLAETLGTRTSVADTMLTEPVPRRNAPAPVIDPALIDAVDAEFILFVDSQHRLVHTAGDTVRAEAAAPVTANIRNYPELLYTVFNGGSASALLPVDGMYALVGIGRIARQDGDEALGYVMVGHLLDSAFTGRIADALHHPVSVVPLDTLDDDFLNRPSGMRVRAVTDSENLVTVLFRAESGNPAFAVGIEAPRTSWMNARKTTKNFLVFFGLMAIILAAAAAYVQHRFILRKLFDTIDAIDRLERLRGSGMRLSETEPGRLGQLARSINRLLDSLEDDREELAAQERERAAMTAASEYKSILLSNVSHEIRTPINGIIGMTELLQETPLDDTQGELVQVLDIETRSLLGLINDILDLSKLEAGKVEAESTAFSLHDMLKPIVMVNTVRARKKGLDFHLYIDPAIPYDLEGDPLRVGQVLTNLVSNAMKFTATGSITMAVEKVTDTDTGIEVAFTVTDTGAGIPPERQKSIFESFSQADASTTRRYGGTGLGLSIVKSLVELMGGEVNLKSKLGAGSSFTVTLPFAHAATPTFSMDADFPPITVLVLTKNDGLKRILASYLPKVNATATFAPEPPNTGPYDMVFIDHGRGTKEDRTFFENVLEHPVLAGADTVLLTYPDVDPGALALRERGVAGVLHKPLTLFSLLPLMYTLHEELTGADFFEDETWFTRTERVTERIEGDFHVLLVEDYPVNQQVAIRHLVRAGIKVDLAENGRDAISMFEENDYDLILMDIQMPVMDGFAATAEIRRIERERNVSMDNRTIIIALTAHAQEKYREQCRAGGMDDYLAKPLRKESLLRMVRTWLETGQAPAVRHPGNGTKILDANRAAPIDVAGLLEEFDNDATFCSAMINDFFTFTAQKSAEIHAAINERNTDALADAAHAAKSGAKSIRADEIAGILQKLEDAGRMGDIEAACRLVCEFDAAMSILRAYLGDHPVNA